MPRVSTFAAASAIIFTVVGLVAGCGTASPTPPPKLAPPPASRPAPKKDEPRKIVPNPEPATGAVLNFDQGWARSREILDDRLKDWVARSEKAMRLLTADERKDARVALNNAQKRPAEMVYQEWAAALLKFGMADAARSISSEYAINDPDYRAVSRIVWTPEFGPEGLAQLAERWCLVRGDRRRYAVWAITNGIATADLREETRDAILDLGLRHWLER